MIEVKSILLVDDDDISNFVTKDAIAESGITEDIFIAMNGEEGLELLKEKGQDQSLQPILVFLDINMPVMDGFEFLESYSGLPEEIQDSSYIVMLTSSTDDEDVRRAKLHTISGYIPKPLTKEKLEEVISKLY